MDTGFNNMLQLICYHQTLVSPEVLLCYTTALDKTFKTNFLLNKLGKMMMMMTTMTMMMMVVVVVVVPVSQGEDEMGWCTQC